MRVSQLLIGLWTTQDKGSDLQLLR